MEKIKFMKVVNQFGEEMWAISSNWKTDNIIAALEANGTYVPEIEHVTFNRGDKTDKKTGKTRPVDATVVDFADGTRAVVVCSAHDTPDKQTAITNAIAKRIFGTVTETGKIDGNGTGLKLKKIADEGFDQTTAAQRISAQKAKTKADHEARQEAAHEAAYARKVKKVADELKLIEDALALIDAQAEKKPLNEANESGYVKPNKKFKDFTTEEKRAYWRWMKRH